MSIEFNDSRCVLSWGVLSYQFAHENYTIGNHVYGSDIYKAQYYATYSIEMGSAVTIERPTGDYVIKSTAEIEIKAGTEIVWKPGFYAELGTSVHASTGLENNCGHWAMENPVK